MDDVGHGPPYIGRRSKQSPGQGLQGAPGGPVGRPERDTGILFSRQRQRYGIGAGLISLALVPRNAPVKPRASNVPHRVPAPILGLLDDGRLPEACHSRPTGGCG
jgi:hypothetical protein